MKRIGLLLFAGMLLLINSCTDKQTKGELLLVGTVHSATDKVNADSVYKLLTGFKPDLILLELDSSFFYEDFTFKTLFEGNEMIATVRYKMQHPDVALRPIEFEGRETYRTTIGIYPEITQEFGRAVNSLVTANKMEAADEADLQRLFYFDSIINRLKNADLATINTAATDAFTDSLNYYKYVRLKAIAAKYPVFEEQKLNDSKNDTVSLRKNFELYARFEGTQRNEALAANAMAAVKANQGKRIIILVGFAHRPYMLKLLKQNGIDCKTVLP